MRSPLGKIASSRRRIVRLFVALCSIGGFALLLAPDAFARYGRGLDGETPDQLVTEVALLFIAFILVIISLFSLIQWLLDRRKKAHKEAEHAQVAGVDWRGGW
jgi:hypothetical protein